MSEVILPPLETRVVLLEQSVLNSVYRVPFNPSSVSTSDTPRKPNILFFLSSL